MIDITNIEPTGYSYQPPVQSNLNPKTISVSQGTVATYNPDPTLRHFVVVPKWMENAKLPGTQTSVLEVAGKSAALGSAIGSLVPIVGKVVGSVVGAGAGILGDITGIFGGDSRPNLAPTFRIILQKSLESANFTGVTAGGAQKLGIYIKGYKFSNVQTVQTFLNQVVSAYVQSVSKMPGYPGRPASDGIPEYADTMQKFQKDIQFTTSPDYANQTVLFSFVLQGNTDPQATTVMGQSSNSIVAGVTGASKSGASSILIVAVAIGALIFIGLK